MANYERDAKRDAFWRGVLRRQVKSGLSVRAFCREEKLSEPSFYAWRRTIAERDAELRSRAGRGGRLKRPAFLPVVVDHGRRPEGVLAIELAGGRVLRLSESMPAQRLAELVQALEAPAQQAEVRR